MTASQGQGSRVGNVLMGGNGVSKKPFHLVERKSNLGDPERGDARCAWLFRVK